MDIITARTIADRLAAGSRRPYSTEDLWAAHDALDAVLFTLDAERLDIARKGAVLGTIARRAA